MSRSQFAVYQLKKKPELRNLLFRTYEELAQDQIPVQLAKDKKNHQKESVLAKLNEKKEEIARRTGQKAMQQVMESEGERTKK